MFKKKLNHTVINSPAFLGLLLTMSDSFQKMVVVSEAPLFMTSFYAVMNMVITHVGFGIYYAIRIMSVSSAYCRSKSFFGLVSE